MFISSFPNSHFSLVPNQEIRDKETRRTNADMCFSLPGKGLRT